MPDLVFKSPLAGVLVPGRHGAGDGEPGVVITEVRRSLFSIAPRRGRFEAANEAIAAKLGLALPQPGRFVSQERTSLLWAGYRLWMLAGPPGEPGPDFGDWRAAMDGLASLADHGNARAMIRVGGPAARRTLARLCAVDLHPRAFGTGHSAATRMGHVGALLHQVDESPVFEIHVFRAFAASFYEELTTAAAEFGYLANAIPD